MPASGLTNTDHLTCPNCGRVFYCSGTDSCWCSKVPVPRPLLDDLASRFDRCLCPDCLNKMIRNYNANRPIIRKEDFVYQRKKGPGHNE